jgi:hypothetical protein
MIKLSESSVMLSRSDGSVINFDAGALQTEIIKSFLAAGIRDAWVAEDIVLAVEYALLQSSRPDNLFPLSEVNAAIIKILEETGYPEVADIYRKNNSRLDIEFSPDRDYLNQLISRHLGLTGELLKTVAEKVAGAAAALDIDSAAAVLFIELAKFYKTRLPQAPEIQLVGLSTHNAGTARGYVAAAAIEESLSAQSRTVVRDGILRPHGISPLFPAIRMTLKIKLLAEQAELVPPVTELMIIPGFPAPAAAVNDCVKTAQRLYAESSGETRKLPVYLNIPDMSEFAAGYLDAQWPEGRECCAEMFTYFEQLLDEPLFKLQMG